MKHPMLIPATTADLQKVIRVCGFINLLAFGLLFFFSYGLTVVVSYAEPQTREIAAFHRLLQPFESLVPAFTTALSHYLSGDSPFARPITRVLGYTLPLLVATLSSTFVAMVLRRSVALVDESVVALLLKMSIGFAVVNFFAYPIFTQDVWYSVVWGRMIVDGRNPYTQLFTVEDVEGIPFDDNYLIRMTYGPLWAILSAGVAWVSQHHIVVELFLFKLILALCWVLSLGLIRQIVVDSSPGHRAMAICLFGWLPMSAHLSIGEAHNDIAMIFFLLLWLYLVGQSQHLLSPFALAISVLIKYITAPLAVLELVHGWSSKILPRRSYLVALLLSVLLAGLIFAPFWTGRDFFEPLLEMHRWKLFSPAEALYWLGAWTHIPVSRKVTVALVRVVFLVIVLYYGVRYHRHREFPQLVALVLAVLCALLFANGSHIFPWFVIWVLAPAAIATHCGLLRLVVPVAILCPFLQLGWLLRSSIGGSALRMGQRYYTVAFYVLVTLAMLMMPRGGWAKWRVTGSLPPEGQGKVRSVGEDSLHASQ